MADRENARAYAALMLDIAGAMTAVAQGMSLSRACRERNLDAAHVRLLLNGKGIGLCAKEKVEVPELEIYDYGEEIYRAVFEDDFERMTLPPDYYDTAMAVLGELTEREQKVLRLRFAEKLNLEETGAEFGVTRERVRQGEKKAIRKLKLPKRAKRLKFGDIAYTSMCRQNELEIEHRRQVQDEAVKAYAQALKDHIQADVESCVAGKVTATLEMSIDEMNLSVRAYNCLTRAGIKTLGQLAGMDEEDFMKIRNLGRKSMQEVIEKRDALLGVVVL